MIRCGCLGRAARNRGPSVAPLLILKVALDLPTILAALGLGAIVLCLAIREAVKVDRGAGL